MESVTFANLFDWQTNWLTGRLQVNMEKLNDWRRLAMNITDGGNFKRLCVLFRKYSIISNYLSSCFCMWLMVAVLKFYFSAVIYQHISSSSRTAQWGHHLMISFPRQLKDCCDVFAPLLCKLANLSFREGIFPDILKTGQITPLIKKPEANTNDLANYDQLPISIPSAKYSKVWQINNYRKIFLCPELQHLPIGLPEP